MANPSGDSTKPSSSLTSPLEGLSFEDALRQLEVSVRQLETGSLPLEEAIAAFEQGMRLSDHCEKKLQEATLKIEKISQKRQAGEESESTKPKNSGRSADDSLGISDSITEPFNPHAPL